MPRCVAAACALLVLTGCARATWPRRAPVAPALAAAAVGLRAVGIPVLLPAALPPPPPGGRWTATVTAAPLAYAVTIAATGAGGTTPLSATAGSIRGGRRGTGVGGEVRALARLDGRPQRVALPGGGRADFYAGQGVTWSEGGWTYAVVDRVAAPPTVAPLLPLVREIRAALPRWGSPVAPGTSGLLVQSVAPDGADIRLTWRAGPAAYAVDGHMESGLQLAESLVRAPG